MSMIAASGKGRVMAAINVTPMADIMIVLLIIFMVITPLLGQDGVTLPSAANANDKKAGTDTLVISIRSDASVALGDDRLDNLGELALRLRERLDAGSPGGRPVYLRADESLPYSTVWTVLQVCREAGADEVGLLSRKKVGG